MSTSKRRWADAWISEEMTPEAARVRIRTMLELSVELASWFDGLDQTLPTPASVLIEKHGYIDQADVALLTAERAGIIRRVAYQPSVSQQVFGANGVPSEVISEVDAPSKFFSWVQS